MTKNEESLSSYNSNYCATYKYILSTYPLVPVFSFNLTKKSSELSYIFQITKSVKKYFLNLQNNKSLTCYNANKIPNAVVLHILLHTTYCIKHAFPFNLDKKVQYWDAFSKFKIFYKYFPQFAEQLCFVHY